MSRPDLRGIRARLEGTTQGSWVVEPFSHSITWVNAPLAEDGLPQNVAEDVWLAGDRDFIVNAPNDVKDLLNYVEELEGALADGALLEVENPRIATLEEQVSRVKKLLESWERARIFNLYTSGVEPKWYLFELNQQLSQALEVKDNA